MQKISIKRPSSKILTTFCMDRCKNLYRNSLPKIKKNPYFFTMLKNPREKSLLKFHVERSLQKSLMESKRKIPIKIPCRKIPAKIPRRKILTEIPSKKSIQNPRKKIPTKIPSRKIFTTFCMESMQKSLQKFLAKNRKRNPYQFSMLKNPCKKSLLFYMESLQIRIESRLIHMESRQNLYGIPAKSTWTFATGVKRKRHAYPN